MNTIKEECALIGDLSLHFMPSNPNVCQNAPVNTRFKYQFYSVLLMTWPVGQSYNFALTREINGKINDLGCHLKNWSRLCEKSLVQERFVVQA